MSRIQLTGSVMGAAGGATELIRLGLGGSAARWVMFAWPAVVILWSLVVLMQDHTLRLNRKVMTMQSQVIRSQAEVIGQILPYIDGRE